MAHLMRFVQAFVFLSLSGTALGIIASGPSTLVQPAAGRARISEEVRTIKTYPFSEPNPVPILVRDLRLYPYHSFEGYAHEGAPHPWKVVHLENDLIEVSRSERPARGRIVPVDRQHVAAHAFGATDIKFKGFPASWLRTLTCFTLGGVDETGRCMTRSAS